MTQANCAFFIWTPAPHHLSVRGALRVTRAPEEPAPSAEGPHRRAGSLSSSPAEGLPDDSEPGSPWDTSPASWGIWVNYTLSIWRLRQPVPGIRLRVQWDLLTSTRVRTQGFSVTPASAPSPHCISEGPLGPLVPLQLWGPHSHSLGGSIHVGTPTIRASFPPSWGFLETRGASALPGSLSSHTQGAGGTFPAGLDTGALCSAVAWFLESLYA